MAHPPESTTSSSFNSLHGGCPCRMIRYTLLAPPLFTHCCHCFACQRESGSAFALNTFLETENVEHTTPTQPESIPTPTESKVPQNMARCPKCKVCVWSNYGGTDAVRYVRVGTLDEPHRVAPDIHIYTMSKQPWVNLEGCGKPVVPEYYDREKYWPKESLERRKRLITKLMGTAEGGQEEKTAGA